jgi:hypothetical protein
MEYLLEMTGEADYNILVYKIILPTWKCIRKLGVNKKQLTRCIVPAT